MTLGIVAVVAAYLVGGIPIGLLVGRAKGVPDIRKYGSGNIGASNVLRVIGVKAGLFVWFMDAMKGLTPVLVATHLVFPPAAEGTVTGRVLWIGAVAVAAMVGSAWVIAPD